MCRKCRASGLLITVMTFFLGVTFADLSAKNDLIPAEVDIQTCVPLHEVGPSNYGPGSEVYRARKERIEEIDQELKSLPETYRRIAKPNGGYFCATSYLKAVHLLQRERELMIDLTEGSKFVHREVCREE